jgi:hypothetical protein
VGAGTRERAMRWYLTHGEEILGFRQEAERAVFQDHAGNELVGALLTCCKHIGTSSTFWQYILCSSTMHRVVPIDHGHVPERKIEYMMIYIRQIPRFAVWHFNSRITGDTKTTIPTRYLFVQYSPVA